jgi:hypothetical protein
MIIAALLLAVVLPRPFAEERDLLDRRLRSVQRALPDGAKAPAELDFVRGLAGAAHLQGVTATARTPVEAPGRGELNVDLVAFGRFTNIETFFRQVSVAPRVVDVVSVALAQTPEETLRMTVVLRLPFWPAQSRLPAPPEGTQERLHGIPKPVADQFSRDQSLLLAKTDALAELRRTRRSPRLFLSELASVVFDRPVVLTELSWGDELFVVRGLVMGDGPMRALGRRLERGYFRISELVIARQGGCRRFEARGRCPIVGPDVELAVARDDPFRPDESPCRVDRDPGPVESLRIAASKKGNAGPFTIRARELDAADLFFVLQQTTGQSFIVDENVRQRLNVDFLGATPDEMLAALAKLRIFTGAGTPVRRVSTKPPAPPRPRPQSKATARPTPAPTATATPEPTDDDDVTAVDGTATDAPTAPTPARRNEPPARASLFVKRASVRDILSALIQADPTLHMVAPPGMLGRLSVWARDVDLPTLRAAVLEAAGLVEMPRSDGMLMLLPVDAAAAGGQELTPIEPAPTLRRLTLRPADVSPDDFDLAAISGEGGSWRSFSYSPEGLLHVYRAGDVLADGAVKSVEPEAVVLDGEDGAVPVRLRPLP